MSAFPLAIEGVGPDAMSRADREAWARLAEGVPDATVFMGPTAFDAWRRTLGRGVAVEVLVARRGTALAGVMPVMRGRVWRGPAFVPRIDYGGFDADLARGGRRPFPVRQLSSVVSWRATSVRPTLLCAAGHRAEVACAMARHMGRTARVDQVVLPVREGEEGPWIEGFRAAGLSPWVHRLGRQVYTIEYVRPFEDLLRAASANFRRNVRRARATATEAGLAFRILEGREAVMPSMGLVARSAAESWKGRSTPDRTAIPYEGGQRSFFEALTSAGGSGDGGDGGVVPILLVAEAGGEEISCMLCFRHAGTLTGLLMFRSARLAAASPGLLGLAALIDWCMAHGVGRFDLNATQDWMRHLADASHELVNVTAFLSTPLGRAYGPIARWRRAGGPSPT